VSDNGSVPSGDDRFDAVLERFDAHLTRFDALLERNDRAFERNTRALEQNTQAFERNARGWGKTVEVLTAMERRLEDMGDQIRANTQALLRVLDRLDGEGQNG
jgi:hypothetical protein